MPLIDTARFLPGPRLRACYRSVQPLIETALGFRDLERRYTRLPHRGDSPAEFARIALQALSVTWEMSETERNDLAAIPGPVVICANHPCGPLEPLALIALLDETRPEACKVLANRILSTIPELQPGLIPVEPLYPETGRKSGINGFRQAIGHLAGHQGTVLIFPAGRVSGWSRELRVVFDRPWSEHPVKLAAHTGASLACVHVEGTPSRLFLSIPRNWSHLRGLLLARELTGTPTRHLRIRLAKVFTPDETRRLAAQTRPADRLRAHCYLGADRALAAAKPPPGVPETTTETASPVASALSHDIARLTTNGHKVADAGNYAVLLLRGDESEPILTEIGRLREITFRAAGQGTGNEIDLSPEDQYYHHLVLWDENAAALIGAYRIGFSDTIAAEQGRDALYLQPLFRFPERFYRTIGPAMELSRSFIVPSRQRDGRALATLWRGLAAAAQSRACRTCYGCVTISNAFHPASRAILVDFLDRWYGDSHDLRKLVHPRNPFRAETRYHRLWTKALAGEKIDDLRPIIEDLENHHRSIPPLIRYYCALGARYLAFHVEPSFNNALYCLLRVDIAQISHRYKSRFGATSSARSEPAMASHRNKPGN